MRRLEWRHRGEGGREAESGKVMHFLRVVLSDALLPPPFETLATY